MRRIFWNIALVSIFASSVAHAQATTRKANFVGWTGTGQELVVETEVQGEVMVDAAARDFYFEATELYRTTDGSFIRRFRRGEAAGYTHPDYQAAKPGEDLEKYLANVGLSKAVHSSDSPDGRWFIDTTYHTKRTSDDDGFRCSTRLRTLLFDRKLARVLVVGDTLERGEAAANEREARCPRIALDVHWHPGSTDWLVEETVSGTTAQRWSLKAGHTAKLDSYLEAPFETSDYAATLFVSTATTDALRNAWTHVFRGELQAASAALADEEGTASSETALIQTLVAAMQGEGKAATKKARGIYKKSPKDAYHEALVGAVWTAAGEPRRAQRHIAKALKKAANYDEKMRLGALFTLVDLSVANQLFIHALSDPGDVSDTTYGYVVLAHALIDARQFAAAEDLLSKYGEDKPTTIRLAEARLALEKGQRESVAKTTSEILEREPAQCLAHRLHARAIAPDEPSRALGHFRAAVACDDTDVESLFLLAGLELEAGRLEVAGALYQDFSSRALPRREDTIREVQRELAAEGAARLSHRGAVLTTVTCRPLGGAKLCQGMVFNTAETPLTDVAIIVSNSSGKKVKTVAETAIPEIPAHESRAFGVRVEGAVDTLVVSAGTSPKEHDVNRIPAR